MPHAKKHDWFAYESKSKNHAKVLIANRKWLLELKDVCPSLSFAKSTMEGVCKQIFADLNGTWRPKVKDKDEQLWVTSMASRLRSACRDFAKASKRSTPPRWLAQMATPAGPEIEALPPDDDGNTLFVGQR